MNRGEFIQALATDLRKGDQKFSKKPLIFFISFLIIAIGLEIYIKPIATFALNTKTIFPMLIFLSAAAILYFYSRPGDYLNLALAILAILLFLRLSYLAFFMDYDILASAKLWNFKHIFCPSHILFYSIPSFILIQAWLRYRCSTNPYALMFIGGIASAGISEIILNFFCNASSPHHLLIWHFIPWLIPVAIGMTFSRRIISW